MSLTADEFRALALDLPGAVEGAHMGHPDFRWDGRIFATLAPKGAWAMVKLTVDQQRVAIASSPACFEPVPGAWGEKGATRVVLAAATAEALKPALAAAWRNLADAKRASPGKPGRPRAPRAPRAKRPG